MIKNERQYKVTKSQAEKLTGARERLVASKPKPGVHPKLRKAQLDALRSQLADLQAELDEYEHLRSGACTAFAIRSLEDLPRALIQARIAAGMSQKGLAERLGLKEQQVQRYESTNYASASLTRVQQVAKALGLQVQTEAVVA